MTDQTKKHARINRRDAMTLASGMAIAAALPGSAQGAAAEHHVQNEHIDPMDQRDPLTNLPNKQLFIDRVDSLIRAKVDGLVVAAIDIDQFERWKETLGQPIMNVTILTLARRLERIHPWDNLHTLARLGEAQFGVLLIEPHHVPLAYTLEQMRRMLRAPLFLMQRDRVFTTCTGAVRVSDHSYKADDVIATACKIASDAWDQRGNDSLCLYEGPPVS